MESTTLLSFEDYCMIASQFGACMNDYLYVCDIQQDCYYITERALDRFILPGNTFHNVLPTHRLFVYEEDLPLLLKDLKLMLSGEKTVHNMQYRWIGKDGSPIWINCKGRVLKDEEGTPRIFLGCINEIGNEQRADNTSGLLGASAFQEQFENLLPDAAPAYILRLGIDDFKMINERLGFEFGNAILRSVAGCIQKNLSADQYVYRIVADEFIILDLAGSSQEDMVQLYRHIRSDVDSIVEKNQYKALYTISAGLIHLSHLISADYNEVMKLSEFALTEAKERGKNQLYRFHPEDYSAFLHRRQLRARLRAAVSNHFEGFSLNFQPLITVNEETLFAAETLLRFKTPEGEPVSPVEFIPILEETGLIIPVGKWVLHNALQVCAQIQKTIPDFRISINLSYIQLLKSPVFDEIMDSLHAAGLKPSSLIVELTESGHLENSPAVQNVWRKLKERGVTLAIDDFGTGYSNLQNIGNLRPDIVKIDRNLTTKALNNQYEHDLLVHIILMVHSIGLKLVVEGIETKEDLSRIVEMFPDYIQGYYYSRPCTLEEFQEKYLKKA